MDKMDVAAWFKTLQDQICAGLEGLDGKARFEEDLWERSEGGGGRTRVLQDGNLIEKGGVNFSIVHGKLNPKAAKALKIEASEFFASGVSIVLHSRNPFVPIIHMNVRYFEVDEGSWWFGGGIDLTPIFVFEEDAQFFHQKLKEVCDKSHSEFYPRFKTWADDYFWLTHRNEARGIGGIFYDRLGEEEKISKEELFEFTKNVGEAFVPIFSEIANRRRNIEFTEKHLEWQSLRRSRYVEFNLVWDRGTKFGLETGGRTESILMSLPPIAKWNYNHSPEEGSAEFATQKFLRKGIDWVNYKVSV
ncbi:MAG: oxygen-dependent coproporphyrinogen oxidase [Saprospiraceae bacterium]|nr:oxygen-dependent coproporphyrinogen oxidase [Saprospiraceae bacterium]